MGEHLTPLILTLFVFILAANAVLIPVFEVRAVLDYFVLHTRGFAHQARHPCGTIATANHNVAALATVTFGAIIVAGSKERIHHPLEEPVPGGCRRPSTPS
jgi:F0F1-type ATP synthase membrane subunit a